jgi:hypothetical protein
MWIVQEVLLAKTIFLACADTYLDWADLEAIYCYLDEESTDFGDFSADFAKELWKSGAMRLIRQKRRWQYAELPKSLPLGMAIRTYQHMECTEIRDRIYALLSVTSTTVVADYSKSVLDVYMDVLRDFVGSGVHGLGSINAVIRVLQVSLQLRSKSISVIEATQRCVPDFDLGAFKNFDSQLRHVHWSPDLLQNLQAPGYRISTEDVHGDWYMSLGMEDQWW